MDSSFDFRAWEPDSPDPSLPDRQTFPALGPLLVVAAFVVIFVDFVMNAGSHSIEELDQFMRQWGMGP